MKVREFLREKLVSEDTSVAVDKIPKPVGSFGYDAWGYNSDAYKVGLSMMKPFYENYFRVETTGLENIPAEGRLLVVANHSGQLPIDGALVSYALATNPFAPRAVRTMIERFFPQAPFVGNILNEVGGVLGDPINCAKMLGREEAIVVFPEGIRGSGKPWRKRYKLQRFGLGFMYLAVQTKTPIVPVGIVGCEETMPTLFHMKNLAKLIGAPYMPVTTPFPLPTKVHLHFGKPLFFDNPLDSEDDAAINVERVKSEITELLQQGLKNRNGWFS